MTWSRITEVRSQNASGSFPLHRVKLWLMEMAAETLQGITSLPASSFPAKLLFHPNSSRETKCHLCHASNLPSSEGPCLLLWLALQHHLLGQPPLLNGAGSSALWVQVLSAYLCTHILLALHPFSPLLQY